MHEKGSRDKGCPKCQLFGCAKAFNDENDCDVFGKPMVRRVARIGKNEKYKMQVDDYRKEMRQTALEYSEPTVSAHVASCDDLAEATRRTRRSSSRCSILDDEDNVESEFSMLKCLMIKDGTYYEIN
jgi:hypothetical protein